MFFGETFFEKKVSPNPFPKTSIWEGNFFVCAGSVTDVTDEKQSLIFFRPCFFMQFQRQPDSRFR